jgi:voltage-gated potassium channel Kch
MKQWLRYKFDSTMSRGAGALIAWLFVFSAILALAVAIFAMFIDSKAHLGKEWWLDFQTTTNLKPDPTGTSKLAAIVRTFVPTLGGMFMGALITGFIVTSMQNKIRDLRKGRSIVVEDDHQVILGWSQSVFTVISELCTANANRKSPAIVVLAGKDKIDMEDQIRAKVPKTGPTKVVCRTGNPIDPLDINLANPKAARSFIVLSPEGADPDSQVIKTMLALTSHSEVSPRSVVAEMRDPKKIEAAHYIGDGEMRLLSIDDLIARITVQACRQSGLSIVYTELLTFDGDEMYVHEEKSLVGKTFGETLHMYETSSVVGVVRERKTKFNPPMDQKLEPGDRLVIISEDDDTMILSGKDEKSAGIEAGKIAEAKAPERRPERSLILGWNRRAPWMINHLDEYVAPGSEIHVVADLADGEAKIAKECGKVKNVKVTYKQADTTDGNVIRGLGVETFDHVITLGYSDKMQAQEADAQTLITLIFLRELAKEKGESFSIVSEMLDPRNRKLAEVARADDFIVSAQLVSQMLAQMSENPDLTYTELFEAEGSEIYLKDATDYVKPGQPVSFYTVVEAARRRNEVAIGYRILSEAEDPKKTYGVRMNPNKSGTVTFTADDKIVVIAEN